LFWVALIDAQQAPLVTVSDDAQTLFFPGPLMSLVPEEPIPAGQEFELTATLRDDYKNLGRNRLVRWFAEAQDGTRLPVAVIRPEQTYTDAVGITRVFVSSPSGGTFRFSVLCEASSNTGYFEPITFDAPPVTP
jgi:hypothetical protein